MSLIDPERMDMIMRLRGRGIFDNGVLKAMETTPRKSFVQSAHRSKAYEEQSLPIACGQTLSAPLTIAMMTQALELTEDHKLLEIGTGSGYHTALLSRMATRVYSVERYHQLITEAEERFKTVDVHNAVLRHGDGRYGWKGQAPFDRILVTCGLKSKPKSLLAQLADGGKMVAVISDRLTVFDRHGEDIASASILPLHLPFVETGKSKIL